MRRDVADAVTCSRFLRGAKGNVGRAVAMFQAHLEWRVRYKLDAIVDEDFADLKAHDELYWGGKDKDGVMTLMWRLRKHDARRTEAKRFVRFFIHQIESGLRTCEHYPNSLFNICVDLDKVGYANTDQEMGIILQSILAKNYPKVRKGLYVFPVNWYATPPPHMHGMARMRVPPPGIIPFAVLTFVCAAGLCSFSGTRCSSPCWRPCSRISRTRYAH